MRSLTKFLALTILCSSSVLAQCPAGTFNNGGTCTQCSAGTYSDTTDATSCTKARRGYYVASAGATSQTACTKGTFSNIRGATSCTDCPVGTFNNVNAANGCCTCCAGYYNADVANNKCAQCPVNRPYSDPGSDARSDCSSTMGNFAPVSSCTMSGRNCPVTYVNGPSQGTLRRREPRHRLCPEGETECPVYSLNDPRRVNGYECRNTKTSLWSCGACEGQNCAEISHANEVECKDGRCVVHSCINGYIPSYDAKKCVERTA